MPTPWERMQQRTGNPYRNSSSFKGRSLAAAKLKEYQPPSALGSTINVEVDPEVEAQKRKEAQLKQQQRMRGLLSGPAALFPNIRDFKEGDGLKLGVETTSAPNENEFGFSTPFKYAYQKAVAPALKGWQSLTETTAGLVATPFSTELQSAKNRGISAGDRWRELDLPTARIGKEKGEGIGFDVGVKGAVELLVDPVGWAMTVLPVGLAFRAASYPAKRLGAVAGRLTGLTAASKKGKAIFKEAAEKADIAIKSEDTAATRDIFKELWERNTLTESGKQRNLVGSLEDSPIIARAHSDMNVLMNYDEVMDATNQLGYTEGLIAYINHKATKSAKNKSGVFFRAINNPIQKFKPNVAKRMTKEGRVETYYNQYISAIATEATLQKNKFLAFKDSSGKEKTFRELFDANPKEIEMEVPIKTETASARQAKEELAEKGIVEPPPAITRKATQDYAKFKISSETIPMNIFDPSDLSTTTSSHNFINDIADATGFDASDIDSLIRVEVNVNDNVVNLTTTQGFTIGRIDITEIVNGSTDSLKLSNIKLTGQGQKELREKIHGDLIRSNKRSDTAGVKVQKDYDKKSGKNFADIPYVSNGRYKQNTNGYFEDINTAGFSFTPSDTVIWRLPKIFDKEKVAKTTRWESQAGEEILTGKGTAGGELRERLATRLDDIIERINVSRKITPERRAKFTGRENSAYLKLTQTQIKEAQEIYKSTINNYFDEVAKFIDDAKDIRKIKTLNFQTRTIRETPKETLQSTLSKNLDEAKVQLQDQLSELRLQFDDQIQFTTLSDSLLNLRNLDEGLRAGQLRVNKVSGRTNQGINDVLSDAEWNGVTREIIRQYAKKDKDNTIDFLVRTDDIDAVDPTINTLFSKSLAFDGKTVFDDFERMFGKNSKRVGKKSTTEVLQEAKELKEIGKQAGVDPSIRSRKAGETVDAAKELKAEFKELYKIGMDDVSALEKEMPVLQFLDMAGFVVGHSHSTGKPIRLFDTGYFDLSNDQIRYLESFYDVFDRGAQILREEGALKAFDDVVLFKSSNYVRHLVEDWGDATLELQVTDDIMKGNRVSNKMAKQAFQKKRSFRDSVSEGFEQAGIKYLDDPANMVEAYVKEMQQAVANAQLTRKVKVAAAEHIREIADPSNQTQVINAVKTLSRGLREFDVAAGGDTTEVTQLIKSYKEFPEAQALISELNPNVSKNLSELINNPLPNDASEYKYFISNNIGTDELDTLITSIADQERLQKSAMKKYAEAQKTKKFTLKTSEELGSGIFGREKKATQMRQLQRYNGSKDGANIADLEGLLFDEDVARSIEDTLGIAEPGAFDRFAESAGKLGDTVRLMQTAIDVGTPFLQGLPALVTRPVVWGKATANMYKTIFSRTKGGNKMRVQFYVDKADTIRRMNRQGISMAGQGNDYFRALNKGGTADFLKGKGFGTDTLPNKIGTTFDKGVGRFQDGFEHFGDQIRVALFEAHEDQVIGRLGREARILYEQTGQVTDLATKRDLVELGEYVNQMTGAFSHTRNMISRRQANMERAFLLFSPAYTRASLGLMGSVLSGGLKGKQAHKAMRNMLAAGVSFHYAQAAVRAEATGEPIEKHLNLDPSKSSFLTTDIAGVKVGFGSFWNSSAKLMARIVADPAFRGDVLDSPLLMTGAGRGQSGFDESGIKSKIANNPVVQWLRGRSSPVGSQFWNLGMGANYLGEELSPVSIDYFQEVGENMFPFWAQNFFDSGLANGATSMLPEFAGLRSYEIPPWERRTEIRNDFAMRTYNELWKDLNDAQKTNIEIEFESHPSMQRLRELDAEMKETRRVVGGGEMDNLLDDYHNDQDNLQAGYAARTAELVNLYNSKAEDEQGLILSTPSDLVKQEKLIRADKNAGLKLLDDPNVNPQYKKVKAYYDSFNDFNNKEKPEDHFAEKYADIYFSPKWDRVTYYDFQGRDAELQDLVNSWGGDGEMLRDYAKGILFGRKMAVDPIIQEFYIGQNKYFDLYYKGAHEAIFSVKYDGEFDELYERWRTSGTRDQELILEKNKRFARAFREISSVRESMREIDQGLDAFLYRFRVGGIGNLKHRSNRDREDELNQLGHMETYVQEWKVAGQ